MEGIYNITTSEEEFNKDVDKFIDYIKKLKGANQSDVLSLKRSGYNITYSDDYTKESIVFYTNGSPIKLIYQRLQNVFDEDLIEGYEISNGIKKLMPVIGGKIFIKISSDDEKDKKWMSSKVTSLKNGSLSQRKK